MTSSVSRRGLVLGITLVSAVGLLTGCDGHAPGELGRLQQLAETCPDGPINSFVQSDGSGSSASVAISEERLKIIEAVTERTVVCGGRLTVQAFSSSSGATATIYNGDLTLSTPTLNARLRQVPETVEAVIAEITPAYGPGIASLPMLSRIETLNKKFS